MKNQKGFTLVELLAVIVILAVVMLIGVTAIGPIVTRSQQSALRTEGIQIVEAAKLAYQFEQSTGDIKSTASVCYDLQWLVNNNYYEKGKDAGYYGSVLIQYNTGGSYTYKVWVTNGTYGYAGLEGLNYEGDATEITSDLPTTGNITYGNVTYNTCNGASVTNRK